jgi:hypothetical protein
VKIVREHTYYNLDLSVNRFVKKLATGGYMQCRPGPNGELIYNTEGIELVPYRFPELVAAIKAGKWILIPEGEHDVDTLVGLGKEATTFLGGAGKFEGRGYESHFRGAKVSILVDVDVPGCRHALQVANALDAVTQELRIYLPAEGFKDVTEHLEAGHPLSDLRPFDPPGLAKLFNLPLRPESRRREPERTLHIVTDDGEIIDESVVQNLRDQLAGAEKENRAWRSRYAELKRDKDADARADESWPLVFSLFKEWGKATGHTRSKFDAGRFYLALPFLRNYGEAMFLCAIHGIATDPFTTTRANGTPERQDGWETMLKSAGSFERYCNRAPLEMLREATEPKAKPKVRAVPNQLTAEM